MNPNQVIVYQAYGLPEIAYEAVYSALSLYKVYDYKWPCKILIFTNLSHVFESLLPIGFDIIIIEDKDILKWQGKHQFVHRLKIEIIKIALEKPYQKLIYVDSDTVFESKIDDFFDALDEPNVYLMHTNEGKIANSKNRIFKKLQSFINKQTDDIKLEFNLAIDMYNAGAIGINYNNKKIIHDVLKNTDILYEKYKSHIVEQYIFSLVFQKNGKIILADQSIFHYWNLKEFRSILKHYFTVRYTYFTKEMLENIDQINPRPILDSKLRFKTLPKPLQWIKKCMGKHWQQSINIFF